MGFGGLRVNIALLVELKKKKVGFGWYKTFGYFWGINIMNDSDVTLYIVSL